MKSHVVMLWTALALLGCQATDRYGEGIVPGTGGRKGNGAKKDASKSGSAEGSPGGKVPQAARQTSPGGSAENENAFIKAVLAELPSGETQRRALCARPGQDRVRQVFCQENPPEIRSLKDLQTQLGVDGGGGGGGILGGVLGGSGFTLTAASSSLVGRFTSAINPRLIMFNQNAPGGPIALGFVRGEQFAEVAARDASTGRFNFFLVNFEQDCNDRASGCNHGELLGPAIESNWRGITIYEDKDIENTILDCKQCHQPGGENAQKILRMQELTNPWTHFMRTSTGGGRTLLADFRRAHPNEDFAGIPAARINGTDPARLERFVRANGFGNQPNEFLSPQIEGGGVLGIFGGGRNQNGQAPQAWTRIYENFVRGDMIAPPYHQVKTYDPAKSEKMTQAYLDLKSGKLKTEDFPDTRDVMLDSGLRDMGYMVKEGLSAEGILMQACAQCHNSKLNQDISRAKFNVDLSKMDREEKDKAIERIRLPATDPKQMPPARFRVLTPEEIQSLEELLKR